MSSKRTFQDWVDAAWSASLAPLEASWPHRSWLLRGGEDGAYERAKEADNQGPTGRGETMAKKLYTVRVEFEYAVMADDEHEACSYADDVARDFYAWDESSMAFEVKRRTPPDGWKPGALVYGTSDDVTLARAWDLCGVPK